MISWVTKYPQQIKFVILVLFLILVLHSLLRSILYINRVSTTYVILPEFGVICVNQLLLHWPMHWLLADLITVTHFLSSISVKDLNHLQGIQNTICQNICRLPRFSSTNCARRSLHWLPVKQRIQFKNLLLTYTSLHTGLSSYLNSALVPFLLHFIQQGAVLLLISSYQQWYLTPLILQSPNSIIALITLLHITGIVYQILFDWPHQFQLFVRGSKLISFGKPFLLHRYTFLRSRTSSVGKVDESESGGPRFESRHGHLRKICLCCWTRHFT